MKILIFGWISLILIHSSFWEQEGIRVKITKKGVFDLVEYTDDSLRPFFKESIEILMFTLNDGRCMLFSELSEDNVGVAVGQLNDLLKKWGYRMGDVAIVVHNHLKPLWFSPRDKKLCHRLVRYGFQGKFLVYFPSRNKTIEYEYKKFKKRR